MNDKSREGGGEMNAETIAEEIQIFTVFEMWAIQGLAWLTCLGPFVVFLVPQDSVMAGICIPLLSITVMIIIAVKAVLDQKYRKI